MYTKIAPRNRSKKLRTAKNHNIFLGIFIALAAITVIGLIGHSDFQYAQLQQASDTCQGQLYNSFDTCMNNQLGDK